MQRRAGLIGGHNPGHRPGCRGLHHQFGQPVQTHAGILDGLAIFRQQDVVGGMIEDLARQPSCMGACPWFAAAIDPAVTQQEGLKLLTRLFQRIAGRLAGSHHVADRPMTCIRNPDRGQLACAVQARQTYGIPAVRFHPVARTLGNQGGRHDRAFMPQFDNLPVKTVTRGPAS